MSEQLHQDGKSDAGSEHLGGVCVSKLVGDDLSGDVEFKVAGINDQGQISKLMLSRLEGQGLVENTQAVNPQCFGPSRLKTGGKTLTHPRPSGAQHNTNRGAYVPFVLQEER